MATLNMWGVRGDWTGRRRVLRDGFRELAPDLVTLQEVIRTEDYDQALDVLGPDFHYVHQADREEDGQGISTASRWPIERSSEVDLNVTARTAGFACASLIAEIDAPAPFGRLAVVNNLPNFQLSLEHERELQAVVTARALEDLMSRRPAHVILAGDFDADPRAASIRFWSGRQSLGGRSVCYRDAWESARPDAPGDTYGPANPLVTDVDWPFRRIDYIFVRCGRTGPTLAVVDCVRIFDQPVGGVWASDHFGVLADLTLPPVR